LYYDLDCIFAGFAGVMGKRNGNVRTNGLASLGVTAHGKDDLYAYDQGMDLRIEMEILITWERNEHAMDVYICQERKKK
jgi:hypothetical protein